MKSIIIRPNDMSAFNRGGRHDFLYHLPCRARGTSTRFASLPANQRTLINIFGYLHGYASHGVTAMSKRWQFAERRFKRHHMPYAWGRSTGRFVNKYTAHKWM